jgi:NAD(P)-dependent dehydrogenase (short-subunit alcohol dehydrogenase family)
VTGHRCVITGGSGALGRAVVGALLERGAAVAVPYRDVEPFRELSKLTGGKGLLWGAPCALERPDEVAGFMEAAAGRLGGIDGLACIAGGYAGSGTFEASPEQEWVEMLRTNLETARLACRAALPHLLKGGGSVVTVGSRIAQTGGAGASAYAVSKAAVLALTRVLALENAPRGVRFNSVLPGTIDTPANRRAMGETHASEWTPPEDIARTIVFLLSDESSPVTGAFIPVEGRSRP